MSEEEKDDLSSNNTSWENEDNLDPLESIQNLADQDNKILEKKSYQTYNYIVIPGNGSKLLKEAINSRGNYIEVDSKTTDNYEGIHMIWRPVQFNLHVYAKFDKVNALRQPPNHLILNHLENIKGISTKTGLVKSLKRYYKKNARAVDAGYGIFHSTPTTFIILAGCEDNEYYAFLQRYKELALGECNKEKMPFKHCQKNLWLVKPAACNQGRGIEIFSNLTEIKNFLARRPTHTYWVVQKYLERPLLFSNRKFDIRVWAVMTGNNEMYFYKEGYIRTSSETYSLDSKENYVHLTNQCLQIHGKNYGIHEEGNTLSYDNFKEYLTDSFPDFSLNFEKDILDRIKDIIIDTYLSIKHELNPTKRKNSYELLGYDFMIDEDFRVWLIEVNSNPYLGTPTTYMQDMLPKMLDDLFGLVLDPICPPKVPSPNTLSKFELLFSERHINGKMVRVNKRRNFNIGMYPIPELIPINSPNKQQLSSTTSTAKLTKSKKQSAKKIASSVRASTNIGSPIRSSTKKLSATPNSQEEKMNLIINEYIRDKHEREIIKNAFAERKVGGHIPQKKLVDQIKELQVKHNDDLFKAFIKKLSSSFINSELLPEHDIKDAIKALKLLQNLKQLNLFVGTKSFSDLIKSAINMKNNLPTRMREPIFTLMEVVTKDQFMRNKSFYAPKFIHILSNLLLDACDTETYSEKTDFYYTKAAHILQHLAWFDRSAYYIPGETPYVDRVRQGFMSTGGMLVLLHSAFNCLNEKIQEFCLQMVFNELDIKDIEIHLNIIEEFIELQSHKEEMGDEYPDNPIILEEIKDNEHKRLMQQTTVNLYRRTVDETEGHAMTPRGTTPTQVPSPEKRGRLQKLNINRSFSTDKRQLENIGYSSIGVGGAHSRMGAVPYSVPASVGLNSGRKGRTNFTEDQPGNLNFQKRRDSQSNPIPLPPELTTKMTNNINYHELKGKLEESLQIKREQIMIKIGVANKLKSQIMVEEIKRREEDQKKYDERREAAYNKLFQRQDEKKKQKIESQRRELIEKETLIKERENKRKNILEVLKRREKERKIKQLEFLKRKNDEEKKLTEEMNRKRKEQMEKQQKILEEWHKRKLGEEKRKQMKLKRSLETEMIAGGRLKEIHQYYKATITPTRRTGDVNTREDIGGGIVNDNIPRSMIPMVNKPSFIERNRSPLVFLSSDEYSSNTLRAIEKEREKEKERDKERERDKFDRTPNTTNIELSPIAEERRGLLANLSQDNLNKKKGEAVIGSNRKKKVQTQLEMNGIDQKIYSIYNTSVNSLSRKKKKKKAAANVASEE